MIYLISAGLISLGFGLMLLLYSPVCKMVCRTCDQVVFDLDKFTAGYRNIFGGLLILVTIIIGSVAVLTPQTPQLHLFWVVSLVFGLFFILLPKQLAKLSLAANRMVFDTESSVAAYCRTVAVVLLLAGVYILYIAYAF